MKLDRLSSTTQPISSESRERARHVADETVLRVAAMEGVEGDRQRSLQQELADFDPRAVGGFAGGELIMANAHELALQLSTLGDAASVLVKAPATYVMHRGIDAKV